MNATRQLPANFGPLKGAQANARVTGPCGDTMEFWLRIEDHRILRATFTTDGCAASIASGAMAASLAEGKEIARAGQIAPDEILKLLGGLPADHQHCPVLAVNTLKAALAGYQERQKPASSGAASGPGAAPPAASQRADSPKTSGSHGPVPEEDEILRQRLGQITCKILVLSGKGGVGKSTVASNLAVALAAAGKRTGLLDVDVHGPSIPKLLGLEGRAMDFNGEALLPIALSSGLKVASLGFLLKSARDAVIWRGPMKYKAIRELLGGVDWGNLDVLVVDCPPGTGDEPLAVAQMVGRPASALVVTTPQQVAIADVRRSIAFCQQVGLPVLGLVENMSGYACPRCGEATALFKTGGGQQLAGEMSVPFLGSIPIDPQIVDSGDGGTPFVERFAQSPSSRAFDELLKPVLLSLNAMTPPETIPLNKTLILAVPLTGGRLSDHFGHCEQFAIIDVDPVSKTILHTARVTPPPHEPGLLPRWLHEQGVKVIIAGGMGQRALDLFAQNGITVKGGRPEGTAKELVQAFLEGSLASLSNGCQRHEGGCHNH